MQKLRDAMVGLGTSTLVEGSFAIILLTLTASDEEAIISVLVHLDRTQRAAVAEAYHAMFSKVCALCTGFSIILTIKSLPTQNLVEDLKGELSGDLRDVMVALARTPTELDVHTLYHTLNDSSLFSEDLSTLPEILCDRTNAQIAEIRSMYLDVFEHQLDRQIAHRTESFFKRMLTALALVRFSTYSTFNPYTDSCSCSFSDRASAVKHLPTRQRR